VETFEAAGARVEARRLARGWMLGGAAGARMEAGGAAGARMEAGGAAGYRMEAGVSALR